MDIESGRWIHHITKVSRRQVMVPAWPLQETATRVGSVPKGTVLRGPKSCDILEFAAGNWRKFGRSWRNCCEIGQLKKEDWWFWSTSERRPTTKFELEYNETTKGMVIVTFCTYRAFNLVPGFKMDRSTLHGFMGLWCLPRGVGIKYCKKHFKSSFFCWYPPFWLVNPLKFS